MRTAFIATWTQPFPGREQKALEYGAEVMDFWGKQAADGSCTAPELFFSEHGTGLFMVKGDRDTLEKIHFSEPGQELFAKAQLLLNDFSVDWYATGADADAYMGVYAKELAVIS